MPVDRMPKFAPVALFGYNRPDHLAKTVEHLRANLFADQTDLYLFSDAAKDAAAEPGVRAVRRLAHEVVGFRSVTVVERQKNWGLRRSLISGVSQVASEHGMVVVVEDDIVTSPHFLRYMNEALRFYTDFETVGSVSAYAPPTVTAKAQLRPGDTFFHYRVNCWGWATWWSRWRRANWEPENWQRYLEQRGAAALLARGGSDLPNMFRDSMEGRNQSWMARWYYNCFLHGMLTLYPGESLVDNIGFDDTGVHCRGNVRQFARYRASINSRSDTTYCFTLPVVVDKKIDRLMRRFWDLPWLPNNQFGQMIRPLYRGIRHVVRAARGQR
ncbi:MAG TPA: glycosyltransferase [Tepidisphaeraceae bacterium]|nr:glycosyltransferase [Tepidisphaeraceae bacterium]